MSRKAPRVPGSTAHPRILVMLPSIADNLDDETKNALAIRNAATVAGRCPDCGAEPTFHVDEHSIGHLTFEHEADCRAFTDGTAA